MSLRLLERDCAADSTLQHRQADSPVFLFAEPIAETAHGFNYITSFAELFA